MFEAAGLLGNSGPLIPVRVKELFRDLLIEMKGFKYLIIMKILLLFITVYFNSTAKTVINLKINLFRKFYIE